MIQFDEHMFQLRWNSQLENKSLIFGIWENHCFITTTNILMEFVFRIDNLHFRYLNMLVIQVVQEGCQAVPPAKHLAHEER